jgi:glycosyltransferase involved in cell wall biosynthesis
MPFYFNKKDEYLRAEFFDNLVSKKIKKNHNYKVFIGWSSMSLNSIKQAKKDSKLVILERGSSHIEFQNEILQNEYSLYDKSFTIDKRIIEKELEEYSLADYISIPSQFVKDTFIVKGIDKNKLVVNNYGTSSYFMPNKNSNINIKTKFRIIYLGGTSIRKGVKYLIEALLNLNINPEDFEVWFIGEPENDFISEYLNINKKSNWKFFGRINHYELSNYLNTCDIAIQPAIEEGLSRVIPQLLACGVPVIATTNTGGADLIEENINGFIIPIRDYIAIKDKIELSFYNKDLNLKMKKYCNNIDNKNTWEDYGKRYSNFLKSIL